MQSVTPSRYFHAPPPLLDRAATAEVLVVVIEISRLGEGGSVGEVRTLEGGAGVAYWGPGSAVVREIVASMAVAIEKIFIEGIVWWCTV